MGIPVTIPLFGFIFFFLLIIQTSHFLAASATVQYHMERLLTDKSGFISLNCGLAANSSYYYEPNGLYYTSDERYISTGKRFQVSKTFYSTKSHDLGATLRSFPEGLRNCYTLSPLMPSKTYLIRTRFLYGNYDGKNAMPVFDVYIGVNFWFTFTLPSVSYGFTKEIIHVATSESIDVCLVNTGKGRPFISVLELRPLEHSSYLASPTLSLVTNVHLDVGIIDRTSIEVKDDAYDRLWFGITPRGSNAINTSKSFNTSQNNSLKIPISVLKTAAVQNDRLDNLSLSFPVDDPTTQFIVYWHFAELELLHSNQTREFNIYLPGYKTLGPIKPKYLQLTTIASPRMSFKFNVARNFFFTLKKTKESTHYPIFNGIETYSILELPASPTNQEDVDAIAAIKDKYAIPRIWQGDPCLPKNYQWDGLNCTYDANSPPRIISLSLSSSELIGELPPSLIKLTTLEHLNLSNNGFSGKIPEFLAYMPVLHVIDLSGNNLTGPVPLELVEKASNKSIDLRLQGNPDVCKSYPCEEKKMEVNKKRPQFIILVVTCVASISFLVIIGIIFLAFKWTKKQEGLVDRTIKSKNKQFTFSEIVSITNNFRKLLGKGGFRTVYYGVLHDGTQVAVKVLNSSSTITLKQFCPETELLTKVHHVNLVSLIGYCDDYANMELVYEFMPCGNLQMHLSERNEHPLSWKARLQISIDVAQGLEYLHSSCRPPIIHRDIKPANILLDEMGRAKIADFGLSRFFTIDSQGVAVATDFAGTRGYLDPEYCKLINSLSEKSDVYAFGIVLLQLLTGQPAIIKSTKDKDNPIHITHWVSPMIERGDILAIVDKRLQGDLNVTSTQKFLEIAMECVKPTGDRRPIMSEVVANLKLCYASGDFHVTNASCGVDDGTYQTNSIQAFDSSIVSLPSAR